MGRAGEAGFMMAPRETRERIDAIRRRDPAALEAAARDNNALRECLESKGIEGSTDAAL